MTAIITAARLGAAAALLAVPAMGSAAVTLTGTSYNTDFDTLIASGTAAAAGGVVANGWQFREGGDNGNAIYAAGTGSSQTGDTYSFGAAGNADRAFGSLGSGNARPAIGVVFNNATGSTITALDVALFGEQWRNGVAGVDSLVFEYRVGGTDLTGTTGWTRLSSLDVLSTVTTQTVNAALNGNANRTRYTGLLSGLEIAQGGTIAFRWSDQDVSGNEDALAIDDFSMTATLATAPAVPEPATWAMMIGGFGLVGGALRRRNRTVVTA